MNNLLVINDNPLSVHWSPLVISRLLIGTTPEQALKTISLLFTLCGQAQQLAAKLLLFPLQPAERHGAQQELAFETLRRLLSDWLPAFSRRKASAAEWQALRDRQFATLAEQLIFAQPAGNWLAAGYRHWRNWLEQPPTEVARWIASLWALTLPAPDLIGEADNRLLATTPAEVSPLALESVTLAPLLQGGEHLAALRLLARCVALARALSQSDSLRWRVFQCTDWQVAAVETARGWLVHQLRQDPAGQIADYRIIAPTHRHAVTNGLIVQTLAAVPKAQWLSQLLIIDPCVAWSMT